jgi:hypothetical protein
MFGPGWDRSLDGTWHFTRYAWKRWRRGGRPKYRRTPPGYRDGGLEAGEVVGLTTPLPARAACPKCLRFQLLDPDVLNARGVGPGFLLSAGFLSAYDPEVYGSEKPEKP